MKTEVVSGLLALIIMAGSSSCHISFTKEPDIVSYHLDISFQDVSGNDLVKGIGLENWYPSNMPEEQASSGSVKDDLYVLYILASQPCQDVIDLWNKEHFVPPNHNLWMDKWDGYWFLATEIGHSLKQCPDEKITTYKLKCPYVFDDEKEHEFIAYWEIPKLSNHHANAICNRVEFEGRVYIPVIPEGSYDSTVVLVVEDRDN